MSVSIWWLFAGIVLHVCFLPEVQCQTMPTGCTYDSGMFGCDFSVLDGNGDIPLQATLFDPIPQRLRLTNLPSSLTYSIFDTDFNNLSDSSYDENYPATLELKCTHSSNSSTTLTMAPGFLANMGHVQDFKIINCEIGNISASAFSELGSLDRFAFENGSIASMDANMLDGIYICRNLSTIPRFHIHTGEFSVRHTKFSGSLPAGLFTSQTELYSVVLEGMELTSISASQFSGNPNLRFLSMGWNDLTDIPAGLFDGLNSLGEIKLYGTALSCSCDSLWFMTYVDSNYLSLFGDIVCNDGDYIDKLAKRYYHANCASSSQDVECDGLLLMKTCMTMIDITANILGILAFIVGLVVLGLAISIKKQLNPASGAGAGRKRPPQPEKRSRGPSNVRKGWA